MHFCIRDDDTNFFTSPDDLDQAYGAISQWGPVSLAVVPFHKAGTSKAIPEKYRGRWTVHPLHENRQLVDYLRSGIHKGQFEIMLHGYYHDEADGGAEFGGSHNFGERVAAGRKYLEDLLGTSVCVFVPPHNAINRQGLRAVSLAGLHLGCAAGVSGGWSLFSHRTWLLWLHLRRWRRNGGLGIPWVLNLGDHREIGGNAITPQSRFQQNRDAFELALELGGVFCGACHYWEMSAPSLHHGDPSVGEHLRYLVDRVRSDSRILWRSVGEIISECTAVV
jgi:hypothetical protein